MNFIQTGDCNSIKEGREFNIVISICTDKYEYIPWLPECYMKQIELNYVIAIDKKIFM